MSQRGEKDKSQQQLYERMEAGCTGKPFIKLTKTQNKSNQPNLNIKNIKENPTSSRKKFYQQVSG